MQAFPEVQVDTNFAYADDIVLPSNNYRGKQDLPKAVNHHTVAFVMQIDASKTRVISALIPGEQRQAVMLYAEPLEDVDKFKYLGSMFIANGQGAKEINLVRNTFSRLQSYL